MTKIHQILKKKNREKIQNKTKFWIIFKIYFFVFEYSINKQICYMKLRIKSQVLLWLSTHK